MQKQVLPSMFHLSLERYLRLKRGEAISGGRDIIMIKGEQAENWM